MVIGGGGMLFNRKVFNAVYDYLPDCRQNYTNAQNDDGAWAKCVTHSIGNLHGMGREGGINLWGNYVCGMALKTGEMTRHHIKNATEIQRHYELLFRHMKKYGPLKIMKVPQNAVDI